MDKEKLDNVNTGFITREYIKPIIHYFCAAVMYECAQIHTQDLKKGYYKVEDELRVFSNLDDDSAVRTITYEDDLLDYFFDPQFSVPGYVCYWLSMRYYRILGSAFDYKHKHAYAYNELQRIYIEHHRFCREQEKQEKIYEKHARRKICRMFNSGEYAATFKLCNKPFSDYISEQEIKNTHFLLDFLFGKQLCNLDIPESEIAVAYILGRTQGRSEHMNGS